MDVGIKNEMQEHLWREFSYSHRIDVEPTPSSPISWGELHTRLNKINFDLNKKYLRTKYFPKWKLKDKFWFIGCKEGGDGTGSELHYHLLLHTPKNHRIDVWDDLYWGWMKGSPIIRTRIGVDREVATGTLEIRKKKDEPDRYYRQGETKGIKVHHTRKPFVVRAKHKSKDPKTGKKINHHVGCDDYDRKFLINVEPVRDVKGSTIYAMKKMHPKMSQDQQFISII